MNTKTLLTFAAGIEMATGIGLIVQPTLLVRVLLGADASSAGVVIARVGGSGLLSLGLACWPGRHVMLPALRAMLAYNLLAAMALGYVWVQGQLVGGFLLPAVLLHAVLAILFARAWFIHEWAERTVADVEPR